ncbi:MAG: acetyl-CoA carboxylase biotin carboxylase subunit, partial [Acidimicrobiales bacterium]
MFRRVLIANRGEVAVRIAATLRAMGVSVAALYSDADRGARHVRDADVAAYLGPSPAPESYLDLNAVLDAAERVGADALHPGYGFLSENPDFAEACRARGIAFIGPSPSAMRAMADKVEAKARVSRAGVPTLPGLALAGEDEASLRAAAEAVGFPLVIKPSAGGGGKGMHVVEDLEGLARTVPVAAREARAAFGDPRLFVERFLGRTRHVEVQVLGDAYGHLVHLGERECTLQRRHQKVIEESPTTGLAPGLREALLNSALEAARAVDYESLGTVEFLVPVEGGDEYYFIEMNTRLQVEHPVTECVTGLDLVEEQVRVAAGEPLRLSQADVTLTGHAIEARLYAEDPGRTFLPTSGRVTHVQFPQRPGVRVDSWIERGTEVSTHYDPLLAKVVAHGSDRAEALGRLEASLRATRVAGLTTNLAYLRRLLARPEVVEGRLDTGLLDRVTDEVVREAAAGADRPLAAVVYALALGERPAAPGADPVWAAMGAWRPGGVVESVVRVVAGGAELEVSVRGSADDAEVSVRAPGEDEPLFGPRRVRTRLEPAGEGATGHLVEVDGLSRHAVTVWGPAGCEVWIDGEVTLVASVAPGARGRASREPGSAADLVSPLPGTVAELRCGAGDAVREGDVLLVVE